MGEEAMSAQVVLYNVDEQDEALAEKVDKSIQASMACLRIVFLNCFVNNLLVSDVFIVRINICVKTICCQTFNVWVTTVKLMEF
jgi:hypothetical protein